MKLTDVLECRTGLAAYVSALGYGFLIAYLASASAEIATVFVAAIFANLLAGKIDSVAHWLGFVAFLAVFFVLGIPAFNIGFLCAFVFAAYADEYIHEFVSRKKVHLSKAILELRPILPLFALVVSFVSGVWTYFAAIILFDLGYLLAQAAFKSQLKV